MSYADAVQYGVDIYYAIDQGHMPPWTADPDYRHFANEELLTPGEKQAILDWIDFGAPIGDLNLEPDPPTYLASGSMLDQINLAVAIEPYTLQSNNEEYRWFVVENPYQSTIYVNKMEVIPGLEQTVHHCDISYDITGNSMAYDLQDPLPGFNSQTGSPTYSYYMNAWQPGGDVVEYPQDWGIAVPPGSDFVLEIHYGPNSAGLVDSTVVNLQFTFTNPVRPVSVGWLLGQSPPTLLDGPIFLPANEIRTYHQEYTVPSDRSFLAICPHMHMIGTSYKVWYIDGNDSVPLIDIPQWNFHWQRYYYFQSVQVIPAGAKIRSEGVYDNTMFNPHQPNNPPQDVQIGSLTSDEMFLTFFIWTGYQPGDEDIIIDSTILLNMPEVPKDPINWRTYPNPTNEWVNIEASMPDNGPIIFTLFDLNGRAIITEPFQPFGRHLIHRINVAELAEGSYILELNNGRYSKRVKFAKE